MITSLAQLHLSEVSSELPAEASAADRKNTVIYMYIYPEYAYLLITVIR
jgi:hypothetical protein